MATTTGTTNGTSSGAPTYDPVTTATGLATAAVASQQAMVDAQTKVVAATATGLTALSSAISTFQTSLSTLTGLNKTMLTQSAVFSSTAYGTATAKPTAAAGSYAFFVEKIATASQVAYGGLGNSDAADGGSLTIQQNGVPAFTVQLSSADADGDGVLSPKELAAAINSNSDNDGKVTAAVVKIGETYQLVLSAGATGADSAITLDTSDVGSDSLKLALQDSTQIKQMVVAQDAVVWLGAKGTGTAITQASNVFTNVDGVSMTFTKAQASGDDPITLTVATDSSATAANVQAFVTAYNALRNTLTSLTKPGDAEAGVTGGAFAMDSGVKALVNRLNSMLRESVGSDTLATYGIIGSRTGTLSLDTDRLATALKKNPTGLDSVLGSSSSSASSGIAGKIDTYLDAWSNSASGQLSSRREANDSQQQRLTDRQARIETQYLSAYKTYLSKFTALQTLQSQMASNTSLFDALFGSDSTS